MKMIKKILLVGLIGTCCFSLVGCTNSESSGFTVIRSDKEIRGFTIREIVDNETGVHYYINTGQGFMCPVYNSDGKVRVNNDYGK